MFFFRPIYTLKKREKMFENLKIVKIAKISKLYDIKKCRTTTLTPISPNSLSQVTEAKSHTSTSTMSTSQKSSRRSMKVKKRLRFSNPESESNSVLNCSLYVEPKLLEWSKNTRQNMEKNTKGNQCTSNTQLKLWELLGSNDETLLLNVTACLRLAWSIPNKPLQFHNAGGVTDYVVCLELVGSDIDLISANVLSVLCHASKEDVCCCTIFKSASLLRRVLRHIICPTLCDRDLSVVRSCKIFIATALSTSHNVESMHSHFDTKDRIIESGFYEYAIELCHMKYAIDMKSTYTLLQTIGNLTETDSHVSSYLWLSSSINFTPITNYLHYNFFHSKKNMNDNNNSDKDDRKNDINEPSMDIKQGLFVRSVRIIRNILENVLVNKNCRNNFHILKRILPLRSIDSMCTFISFEYEEVKSSRKLDRVGERVYDCCVQLLWSVATIESSGGSGIKLMDGKRMTNYYFLPIVTPTCTMDRFVSSLISTQQW